MIVMKKKVYILMLLFLAAAVILAAWKNIAAEKPALESGVFSAAEETNKQEEAPPQVRSREEEDLVGVWIPYMSLTADGTEAGFKENFEKKLQTAVESGANAVFVHVRPFADSLYPSAYAPWSHILTGEQGKDPGYDPLAYMIGQTHAAGLQFHAWVNPLRISTGQTPDTLAEESFYMQNRDRNPHYFMEYEGGIYYNPAVTAVREHIADGIAEIVAQYDVDGIHFDDYFYPAAGEGTDATSYEAYQESTQTPLSLQEWRTANINTLIASVYRKIKAADAEAVFGISPQGNLSNNAEMGADIYTWCAQKGYIDYICPQLYYSFENAALPFETAMRNWLDIPRAEGIRLYIGLAVYKAGTDADGGTWMNSAETLARQIEYAEKCGADGVVLYAVDHMESDAAQAEMANAQAAIRNLYA